MCFQKSGHHLHDHSTTVKIRKLTLIESYYLHTLDFTKFSGNSLYSQRKFQTPCEHLSLVSFPWSETVPCSLCPLGHPHFWGIQAYFIECPAIYPKVFFNFSKELPLSSEVRVKVSYFAGNLALSAEVASPSLSPSCFPLPEFSEHTRALSSCCVRLCVELAVWRNWVCLQLSWLALQRKGHLRWGFEGCPGAHLPRMLWPAASVMAFPTPGRLPLARQSNLKGRIYFLFILVSSPLGTG